MKKLLTLAMLSLSSLTYSQNLLNGLQACYPLDGNANNSAATGSALNGTLVGVSPANGHSGQPNTAYSLNGSVSSYIVLPDHPGLKSNNMFFTGWFKFNSLTSNQYMVYTKNTCFNNFEAYALNAYYDWNTSQYVFVVTKSDASCTYAPQLYSTTGINLNTWYHVGFFVTDSVLKLYVNGSLEASTSHTILFDYTSGKNVFIGITDELNYNLPSDMVVDNMRFYNRELTAAEVLSLYNSDPPCSDVNPGTAPTASFTASKKQICKGQSVSFTNLSSNNPVSYAWSFPGGSPLNSTTANPTVTFPNSGVYVVSLVATNSFGSSSAYTTTITVIACTSISENDYSEFKYFPNPSSGKITVTQQENTSLKLVDLTGKLIPYSSRKLADNSIELDLSENASGIYFITLLSKEGSVLKSLKIILEK